MIDVIPNQLVDITTQNVNDGIGKCGCPVDKVITKSNIRKLDIAINKILKGD